VTVRLDSPPTDDYTRAAMMTPNPVARDVSDDVRTACESSGRPTTPGEVQRALSSLDADELQSLAALARGPLPARPLGPDAFVDILRGTQPTIAAARELGGYYALRAERDALVQLTAVDDDLADEPQPRRDEPAEEPAALAEEATTRPDDDADTRAESTKTRKPKLSKDEKRAADEKVQALVTLFAYHRDAVRVAQELGVGLAELNQRVESLGLRRRIHRLLETTTDIELFSPERISTPRGEARTAPVLRKRGEKPERAGTTAADLVEDDTIEPEEDATGPAARTAPVNAHGTRVYRRTPASKDKDRDADDGSGLAPRREYVRETRRKERQAPKARSVAARPPEAPPAPARTPFLELQGSAGRDVLDRLLADEKANPRVLAAKLAEKYDGPAERPLNESDLRLLLGHHGLSGVFADRERLNARFLIGFHQGARSKLLNALQLADTELDAYLRGLGLLGELEALRIDRSKLELGRKKLADRLSQVLTRAPYLDDLGVLPVIDREVREHVEALLEKHAAAGEERFELVRAELGVEANACAKLLRRYELAERAPQPKPATPA